MLLVTSHGGLFQVWLLHDPSQPWDRDAGFVFRALGHPPGSTLDRSGDPGEAPGAHPHCSPTLPSAQQGHMAGAQLLTWLGPCGQQPSDARGLGQCHSPVHMGPQAAGAATWESRRHCLGNVRKQSPDPPVSPEKSEIPIWIPRLQNLGASPV